MPEKGKSNELDDYLEIKYLCTAGTIEGDDRDASKLQAVVI